MVGVEVNNPRWETWQTQDIVATAVIGKTYSLEKFNRLVPACLNTCVYCSSNLRCAPSLLPTVILGKI